MNKTKDIVREEALAEIGNKTRAGVHISMGVGKTLIGLTHASQQYSDTLRFLVVGPKLAVNDTWREEADKYNLGHLIPHMSFTTYLSLPDQDHDYDIVYLDECHSLLYSHEEWLNNFKGTIIGLTGTWPRFANSEKGVMVNKFCPLVYRYTTDKAIDDNILNDYRIIVHKLILSKLKTIQQKTKKGTFWWTSEQDVYDYWCKRLDDARGPKETQIVRVMRMKALMGFPSKENLAKKLLNRSTQKCILFANTQDQADRMCPNSYHSNNPISDQNLMAFKEGTIDKLSCVLQLNEGVNIPNLKEGIIMHAYGNERKSAQRIGRLLRLNPDDTSTIHVLCYKDTVDEDWTADALRGFDSSKISWVDVA